MPSKSETELRYDVHRLVEVLEAANHIRNGEPKRSIHHFLKAYMPDIAFAVYKLSGGKAGSVRDMLIESTKIVEEGDGIDWITLMYGKEYDLSRKSK